MPISSRSGHSHTYENWPPDAQSSEAGGVEHPKALNCTEVEFTRQRGGGPRFVIKKGARPSGSSSSDCATVDHPGEVGLQVGKAAESATSLALHQLTREQVGVLVRHLRDGERVKAAVFDAEPIKTSMGASLARSAILQTMQDYVVLRATR